ncbi:hypothetical protein [Halarsenatibacter silvermanii]|uniref:Bacteriophage holin of superfamily 6 (Holin_LLH) n=1 Tax=Halarsenatibacter silvermanii TaxID=321763 RepID=A0A1G9RDZ7_9FIRM|nr:hypothetical protein [Halarsenatibacter silvermanii]SDM21444.1 hypothetical protein SAMN04488692_12150 [Halarsenatibacter silvermanii]
MGELLLGQVAMPIVVFILGYLVSQFVAGTKHQLVFTAIIKLVEAVLESYEIDVPDFLRELLEKMHEISEETGDYEDVVLDEINRLEK